MGTFYVVLITIAAWHLLNFIVLALVERYGRYVETEEMVMVWLNTAIFLAPFWVIYKLPQIIYARFFKYRLYMRKNYAYLVRGFYKKTFDKKNYLDDREVGKSLKGWRKHEYLGEKRYTYIKKDKYYLLIKKQDEC